MITLINPNVKVEVVKTLEIVSPPLGLGYLASVLRERGFKVRIIDDLVEKLSIQELIRKIKDSIIVGITSTTPTFKSALEYAKKIKKTLPNVFIILGGVHVTFQPEKTLENDFVDAVCIGEGEKTILDVAERIESEKNLKNIRGVYYKEEGRIRKNPLREFIENLDSIPFPAFDLMPLENYTLLGKKLEVFPMITSRGCPFACRYCSSSLFMGHRFRARSVKNVVDEIEWLVDEFYARHIAFGDDTFTLNKRRVEEICKEIRKRGIEVTWSCSSRIDTINNDLLKMMKSAGCTAIYYGVESSSKRIIDYYKKRISIEKAVEVVKFTKKLKITTICSFIIGAPIETKNEMEETLKLAIKLDPDYAQFSILTPYPGTEIYEEAKEKGLLLTENYDEYTAGNPVLRTQISKEELAKFLRRCYIRFYLRPKFMIREIKKRNFGVIMKVIKKVIKS
ncbi:MAG: radical SAM protein [Archaeoglobaceae archaeon]|nr:B12-binding domain-containing radical SAM protein [Archaeoglobaceae archaeon]MDW7990168.1 radical SAM protein [Archaeoglobaceae archaeon]